MYRRPCGLAYPDLDNEAMPPPHGSHTAPIPNTHYGALKLALEAHASAFAAADGVCYASLRPTSVCGLVRPVARSKWFDLARAVTRRRAWRRKSTVPTSPPRSGCYLPRQRRKSPGGPWTGAPAANAGWSGLSTNWWLLWGLATDQYRHGAATFVVGN